MDKEKFLETEMGKNMVECVKAWDMAIGIKEMYNGCDTFYDEYKGALEIEKKCKAQWGVYQTSVRQCYGVEVYFIRVAAYFGIELIVSGNSEYLLKYERQARVSFSA